MRKPISLMALILALALGACGYPGANPSPTPTVGPSTAGQPVAVQSTAARTKSQERGAYLFRRGVRPLCSACHSLEEGRVIVGPSLAHVGQKGEAHLRAAITQKDRPPASGFAGGVMPVIIYAKWLPEDQVTALVDFLLTQQ